MTAHVPHEFKPGQLMIKWNAAARHNEQTPNPNFCTVCGRRKDHVLHTAS